MITIAKGDERLQVSEESYKTFFKEIGYQIIDEKKVINAKKEEPKKETVKKEEVKEVSVDNATSKKGAK